jgi:hypothetical protein
VANIFQRINKRKRAYQKKILKAINDGVDTKDRLPIFTENIQTDIALQIYIRMIYLDQK